MNWSEQVDLAFARRRHELAQELVAEGVGIVDELGAVAAAAAARHPCAYLGSGVVAGAFLSLARGAPERAGSTTESHPLRAALAMVRLASFGASLLS